MKKVNYSILLPIFPVIRFHTLYTLQFSISFIPLLKQCSFLLLFSPSTFLSTTRFYPLSFSLSLFAVSVTFFPFFSSSHWGQFPLYFPSSPAGYELRKYFVAHEITKELKHFKHLFLTSFILYTLHFIFSSLMFHCYYHCYYYYYFYYYNYCYYYYYYYCY